MPSSALSKTTCPAAHCLHSPATAAPRDRRRGRIEQLAISKAADAGEARVFAAREPTRPNEVDILRHDFIRADDQQIAIAFALSAFLFFLPSFSSALRSRRSAVVTGRSKLGFRRIGAGLLLSEIAVSIPNFMSRRSASAPSPISQGGSHLSL